MTFELLSHRSLLALEGICLIVLGILAAAMPALFTFSVMFLLGCLFLLGGLIQGFRIIRSYPFSGFAISAVVASFYILSGILLLVFPNAGLMYFTMLLALFFFFVGLFKIIYSLKLHPIPGWGLFLLSGIISLVLAIIIWAWFPDIAGWLLGLLAGVNMICFGSSLVVLSMNKPMF